MTISALILRVIDLRLAGVLTRAEMETLLNALGTYDREKKSSTSP